MSDLPQLRRWQADEYEKKNQPRVGELNIPQILRDDADEIDELRECELYLLKRLNKAVDEIERLRELTENDGKEIGSYRQGNGLRGENRRMEAKIERLTSELEELRADAEVHDEQLTKVARIRLDLEVENAKLQAVVDAADYLSAEVMDAWANSRLSIDTIDANDAYQKARAALKEADDD